MVRNLAVGIDAARPSEVPLLQALELAVACSARLHLLAALGEEQEGDLLGGGAPGALEVALPPEDGEEEAAPASLPPVLEKARLLCHEEQVPCRVQVHLGGPWPWLVEKSRVADLLVLGAHSGSRGQPGWGRTVRRVLAAPALPTLVCGRETAGRRRALLYYDASPAASRALALTAVLCEALNIPLTVVAAAAGRDRAHKLLAPARERLLAYHLNPEFHAHPGDPARALAAELHDGRPSLLALPVTGRRLGSFVNTPLAQVALRAPDPATLVVP